MLSENDKIKLMGSKRCFIMTFFQKRKILKGLNARINEADKILAKYPKVEFSNVFETALFQSNGLFLEEQKWATHVENYLCEIFGDSQSTISVKFTTTTLPEAISGYAKIRVLLEKKKEILVEFQKELKQV